MNVCIFTEQGFVRYCQWRVMKALLEKYANKMVTAGLADEGAPLLGGLDAELQWNRDDVAIPVLKDVFSGLNINSLLCSRPAEPYRSIIDYLASSCDAIIKPEDTETRTFIHDIPVVREFRADLIIEKLKIRKSVIIPGRGIVTWGTVSPEQAFIFYSSVCFGCFVKFFTDYLHDARAGRLSIGQKRAFEIAIEHLEEYPEQLPSVMRGPFEFEEEIYRAVSEAGRLTVESRLVDSFFGNVSMMWNGKLYISQTTSSLDELDGCIDPCPLDNSACTSITASSEFTAHVETLERTGMDAMLHGHPKFAVIISLDCEKEECEYRGECHIKCTDKRFAGETPIVPGEVGSGRYGLFKTLPQAMRNSKGVIVYGHGLFTVSRGDFRESYAKMLTIEKFCRSEYFRRLDICPIKK